MKTIKKSVILKKRIIELDFDKINEDILYLINEARTSPKNFLEFININNTNDEEFINLLNFFKYDSEEVPLLISDPNLSICSKDLLEHLISDENNKEEIDIKSLKSRLRKLNLIPINYGNFIIFDAIDPLDVVINLFLNDEYRMKILNPEIKYIGIVSCLYHTGNLCIVIDFAQSLKSINLNCNFIENGYKNITIEENDYNNQGLCNFKKNYSDKKHINKKRIFGNAFNIPNGNYEKVQYKDINKNKIKIYKYIFPDYIEYNYKYPISVNIKKDYIKDKYGNIHKIYTRESNYDDGSVLIQPDIDFIY